MKTIIIESNRDTRLDVMHLVSMKLNTTTRPVMTFRLEGDKMCISGCSSSEFFSALPERLGKRIKVIAIN